VVEVPGVPGALVVVQVGLVVQQMHTLPAGSP